MGILKFTLLYFKRVFRFTSSYVYLQFRLFKYSELSIYVPKTIIYVKKKIILLLTIFDKRQIYLM